MENRSISHPSWDKGPLICVGIWKGIDQRALSNNVVKVLFAGGNRKTQQVNYGESHNYFSGPPKNRTNKPNKQTNNNNNNNKSPPSQYTAPGNLRIRTKE